MSSESKMELHKKSSYYSCYVRGCLHTTLNYNKAFFGIPTNLQRRNHWLKLMHREDLIGTACLSARVCEEHFTPDSIKHHQIRTLLFANAYPQLRLPKSLQCEKETQTEPGEITLCVCDLEINYKVETLIKTNNYLVKSYTKLTDPFEGQRSSTNESEPKGGASTCRRTKLIPLFKHAEDIIVSVYNYLEAEYEELKSSIGANCDLSPLANILKRTAAATGVSEQAVSAILDERILAAGEELETSAAKRAKLFHDYGDGNVGPIKDDEPNCKVPDKEQDDHNEQTQVDSQEPIEFEVETLKVEIKEEIETDCPVQRLIFSSNSKRANISIATDKIDSVQDRKPPPVLVYPQSSAGVLRVMSIEPLPSFATVKIEPDDDPANSDTTSCDVTYEPPPS